MMTPRHVSPLYELRCRSSRLGLNMCGLRVPADYFEEHPAFAIAVCPNCGAPMEPVFYRTDQLATNVTLDFSTGRIVAAATLPGLPEGEL